MWIVLLTLKNFDTLARRRMRRPRLRGACLSARPVPLSLQWARPPGGGAARGGGRRRGGRPGDSESNTASGGSWPE